MTLRAEVTEEEDGAVASTTEGGVVPTEEKEAATEEKEAATAMAGGTEAEVMAAGVEDGQTFTTNDREPKNPRVNRPTARRNTKAAKATIIKTTAMVEEEAGIQITIAVVAMDTGAEDVAEAAGGAAEEVVSTVDAARAARPLRRTAAKPRWRTAETVKVVEEEEETLAMPLRRLLLGIRPQSLRHPTVAEVTTEDADEVEAEAGPIVVDTKDAVSIITKNKLPP